MVRTVSRLPQHLQSKWRHIAVKQADAGFGYPNLQKLVEFVEISAREVNDPVFGLADSFATSNDYKCKNGNPKRGSSFGVVTRGDGYRHSAGHSSSAVKCDKVCLTCFLCSGEHVMSKCDRFLRMSPDMKLKTAREKRLCFNCLSSCSHNANGCRRPGCGVDGSNLKHSGMLHEALTVRSHVADVQNEGRSVEAQSCACGPSTESRSSRRIALPIVSVVVKCPGMNSSVRASALLDPGSDRSFCLSALLRELGVNGTSTSLSLATLNENQKHEVEEVCLEVSGIAKRGKRKIIRSML